MASQVVTLTVNPALDKSTQVDNVVAERKLRCESAQWQAGGGGINVARVVKRLGGEPLAVYTKGGPQGEMLQDLLDESGLDQEIVPIAGMTRQSFAVREKSTDSQYRFSMPGPTLSQPEWRQCFTILRQLRPAPKYIVLSGGLSPGIPDDFYGRIVEWAQQNGSLVILDAHDEPLREAVAAGVFLLKPNLRELRQLTGGDLESEDEQLQALQQIIDSGTSRYIVLSLGAAGAVFAGRDMATERLRAPTVTIRSKVGAGDSMVGGIVYALTQGSSPLEAARFGVAAGAAAVMTPGTDLCHRKNVIELYDQLEHEESATLSS